MSEQEIGVVTDLIAVGKNRYKVYIDQEFAFVLYKGELHKYGIRIEHTVSTVELKEIREQVLTKRAKQRAMHLLTKRDYTQKELFEKLEQGGYPKDVISDALAYVESFRYVDDERYAISYIRTYEDRKPTKKIKEELTRKGIDRETIESAYLIRQEEVGAVEEFGQEEEREYRLAREYLQKKHYNPTEADQKEKKRLFGFLARKGFSTSVIYRVLQTQEPWDAYE